MVVDTIKEDEENVDNAQEKILNGFGKRLVCYAIHFFLLQGTMNNNAVALKKISFLAL